ncbi:MAG: hypothetical protein Q9166_007407 [cf. Caloplaca sp. 2 TL-2023]
MILHESESSGEEDEQYSTTNVMLGYASTEPTDDTFSHLGGVPTWLDDESPTASLAKCKICNSMMALLLQLNGDLPEYFPDHGRKLYVFACRNKPCQRKPGAIRAIRGIKIFPSSAKPPTQQNQPSTQASLPNSLQAPLNLGDSIFKYKSGSQQNNNPNLFSTSSKLSLNANPFSSTKAADSIPYGHQRQTLNAIPSLPTQKDPSLHQTFAQKARHASPPPSQTATRSRPPWPSPALLPQSYPSFHLDAGYETLETPSPTNPSSSATFNTQSTTSNGKDPQATDEDDDPANWLSGPAKADKTFLRFAARLAQNPEQVLRYEWCGQPLLYSKDDEVGQAFPSAASNSLLQKVPQNRIPGCTNCGAKRVFEFQLTPQAISKLEREEEGLEGMEWGTVVVGSCEKDCGERGMQEGMVEWVEEWVGVSWEESVKGGR